MNFSAIFIKRPIATTLLAIGIAISGIVGFSLLPVAPLPQIEFPTISIQAFLPGSNPETMATAVATPLERQLGRIAGITQMTSSSYTGSTRIIVQFDLSRNIDGAARDVQAAINASLSQLPTNLPSLPTYRKVNPADAPILIISLTSDIYDKGALYDAASTILQQKLSQVNGVGQVVVGGSSLPAVRVELNPTALSNYGIGLNDVSTVLANANANRPKGELSNQNITSELYANDQIFKAYQYKPLIITYANNQYVRIQNVAEVKDSVEDLRNAGLSNGKSSVLIVIFKQPGANVIDTNDRIQAMLPQLKAQIPKAINMTVTMDRTTTIRTSLFDVEITLLIAMILVIAVVFLFLGSFRAMLIPSVAVPLSLLGTFGIMELFGFSLDNLSLMALTISTGFVVDDAVVVLENIIRHIEMGANPLEASLIGAQEVSFTVLSMSLSLIAVFIPILLMGGLIGRLFREFAITLSIAILVSLVISLTVTPTMCAHLLKPEKHNHQHSNKYAMIIKRIRGYYGRSLEWVLHHQHLFLWITLLAICFNIYLFIIVPKGFFPQQDTGRITGSILAEQDISFQLMQQKLAAFSHILLEDPAVKNAVGFVASSGFGAGSTNTGSLFITLKPLNVRKVSADHVINRLRPKLATVPGANLYLQAAQDFTIGGRPGASQFQYTMAADNLNELNTWVPKVMQQLTKVPGVADVNSDQYNHGLQVMLKIDRDAAARLNITTQQIDDTLYSAFGQRQVSTLYTTMNQYHVIMEVAPEYWQNPSTLNDIYIKSATNKMVPLSAIAKYEPQETLLSVNHQGQSPAATLSFNLLPNASLGNVVDKLKEAVTQMHLPSDIYGVFQGITQAFQQSLATEPYLICVALLSVYIVLGMLYESTIHPITILSTLPSAGVGAILALLFTKTDLSMIALIGIILLIGIVKKNAIMMIDFAIQEKRSKKITNGEAILQAAIHRFRPIMMTTMAAIFGALPLAVGFGEGSEIRRPLGISIIGGLIVSQLLTLYSTPVIYLALERRGLWLRTKWTELTTRPKTVLSSKR